MNASELRELQAPLKRVLRRAEERDKEQEERNRDLARRAITLCADRVKHHGLPMKLIQTEYNFDATRYQDGWLGGLPPLRMPIAVQP